QGVEVVEPVPRGKPLQADRGEPSRGFSEGKAGVTLAVEELHPVPLNRQDAGEDGASEAGADDRDSHQLQVQVVLGSARPVRFMRSSRAIRTSAHSGQIAKRRASQRSAVTIPPKDRERSRASSSWLRPGGVKSPDS